MKIFGNRAVPIDLLPGHRVDAEIPVDELPPGTVKGVGPLVVGNSNGRFFAVSRSCRHALGDLAQGTIDRKGCLVCPVHGARYDVETGRMVRGPRGIYARIPALSEAFVGLTRVLPLRRAKVVERDGTLYISR